MTPAMAAARSNHLTGESLDFLLHVVGVLHLPISRQDGVWFRILRASLLERSPRESREGTLYIYENATFDAVVSLIGAMFAPRPELVAAELTHVCRPGGVIAMANWTGPGFVGQMFKAIAKHIAPSGMP
jgi:SAM-dependent methyltransferase